MLCCIGLFAGAAVGQYLGGPWTYIGPVAGFGIGMAADMKFMKGCHMGGQRHADSDAEKDTNAVPTAMRTATDPVCGMEVDGNTAKHQAWHAGKTYYFCTPGCKNSFEQNPEKYVGATEQAKQHDKAVALG